MFCNNCGQELTLNAKYCHGCGMAVDDAREKDEITISEKADDNSVSPETTECQQIDTKSSVENKLNETEKDAVQTQPTESLSESEQIANEAADSTNKAMQIEALKCENSKTEDIKEVLLPQKKKNGKVKFKDLPKKQKTIRIIIGAGLILIALIWMFFDGISTSEKAVKSNDSYSNSVIQTGNDDIFGGYAFDMTLDDFFDRFNANTEKMINMDYADKDDDFKKSYLRMNTLTTGDFEKTVSKEIEGISVYYHMFQGTGNYGSVLGTLQLFVNDETRKIQVISYAFYNEEAYRNEQSANKYIVDMPVIIFSTVSKDCVDNFLDVYNGVINSGKKPFLYKDHLVYTIAQTDDVNVSMINFMVTAADKNSKFCQQIQNSMSYAKNSNYEKENGIYNTTNEKPKNEQFATSRSETNQNDTTSTNSANIYVVNTKSDNLRIREAADLNSKVIGSIPKGTKVIVTDEENGFLLIKYNDITGWASKDYLVKYTGESSVSAKSNNSANSNNNRSSENNYQTKTNEEVIKDIAEDVADYAIDKGVDVAKDVIRNIF